MSSEVVVVPHPAQLEAADQVSAAPPAIADELPVGIDAKAELEVEEPQKPISAMATTPTTTTTGKTTSDSEDLSENVLESASESGAITTPPYEVIFAFHF